MPSERLLAQPADLKLAEPLARVRSTLLVSSIATLRERSLYDAYLEKLPAHRHDDVQSLVAGVWTDVVLAMDHYAACEALGLNVKDVVSMGAAVGHRFQANVLSTLTRVASGIGVTPWSACAIYDRLWARMFIGGGFAIDKTGPKDATLTVVQLPLLRFAYFRAGFRGVQLAGFELFAKKVFLREVPSAYGPSSLVLHLAWA